MSKNTEKNITSAADANEAQPVLKPEALPLGLTRRLSRNGNVIESYNGDPAQLTEKFERGISPGFKDVDRLDLSDNQSGTKRITFGGNMIARRVGGAQ